VATFFQSEARNEYRFGRIEVPPAFAYAWNISVDEPLGPGDATGQSQLQDSMTQFGYESTTSEAAQKEKRYNLLTASTQYRRYQMSSRKQLPETAQRSVSMSYIELSKVLRHNCPKSLEIADNDLQAIVNATGMTPDRVIRHRNSWTVRAAMGRATNWKVDTNESTPAQILSTFSGSRKLRSWRI